MHRKIILESFKKSEIALINLNGKKPSNSGCAMYISEKIYGINSFVFGERSLRDLYNLAKSDTPKVVEIKQPQVVDALCKYLDYDDYADFVFKNTVKSKTRAKLNSMNISGKRKHNIIIVCIIAILVIAITIYISIDKARWMIWHKDRYIEIDFDSKIHSVEKLKVYDEVRIKKFNKISPSCEYLFFKKDGSVNVWYGKNAKKEIEFFTDLGRHPDTGKTLKPITQYMIDKYICCDK